MSRNTIKLNTSNLLVIAHGKSEYEIFEYIFQAIEKPKYICTQARATISQYTDYIVT